MLPPFLVAFMVDLSLGEVRARGLNVAAGLPVGLPWAAVYCRGSVRMDVADVADSRATQNLVSEKARARREGGGLIFPHQAGGGGLGALALARAPRRLRASQPPRC